MRRPAWYIAALVLAAVAVAIALWVTHRGEPTVRVIGTCPIAHGEALLTLQGDDADAREHWLQLVTAGGAVRWDVALGDRVPVSTLGTSAITATPERVFALITHAASGRFTRLVAIERGTGALLWETGVDDAVADKVVTVTSDALFVDAERVYLAHAVGTEARVDAYALASGAHLWVAPLPATNVRLRALDETRLLATPRVGAAQAIDRTTGAATPRGWGVYLGELGGGVAIGEMTAMTVLGPTGEPERYTVGSEFGVESRAPLGVWNERWVIAGLRVLATNAVALGGFDRDARALSWSVDLGRLLFATRASDGGPLPRFVAAGVHGRPAAGRGASLVPPEGAVDAGQGDALVVVDLAEQRVAWQVPLDTTRFEVFDALGRDWVWLDDGTLVAIDPVTGHLQRATAFAGVAVSGLVNEEAIRHGQLWLRGEGSAPRGEVPLVVVDLATGLVVFQRGAVGVSDVTALVRAMLRVP